MRVRSGFGSETHEDGKGKWVTFTLDDIPIIGVEIPLYSNSDTPFNIFWWGLGTARKLTLVTTRLVASNEKLLAEANRTQEGARQRKPGFIRSVCYGSDQKQGVSDWKRVTMTELGKDPVIYDGTLNVRFEYVPDPDEDIAKVVTWTRFHTPPDPSDFDAVESVGIFLPFSLFTNVIDIANTTDAVSDFIRSTFRALNTKRTSHDIRSDQRTILINRMERNHSMAQSKQLTSFYVTTRVASDNKADTTEIDDKTSGQIHVIELENTTMVRRDAQSVGYLSSTTYVAFDDGAGKTDKWSCEHADMLHKETRSGQCSLEHVKAAPSSQLIRVNEVNTRRANGKWVPDKSGNVPFGIYIDIK
jgi:hypothetical protein